jgi:hypothetical protein
VSYDGGMNQLPGLVTKLVAPVKRGGVRLTQDEARTVLEMLHDRDQIIEASRRHLRHSDCEGSAEWCGLADLVRDDDA